MTHLAEIHDREITQRRHNAVFAGLLLLAITLTIASIVSAYT